MSPPPARRPVQFSWWGLVLCLIGTGLILVYRQRPTLWTGSPMAKIVYLGMGALLILWGIRTVVAEMWPVAARVSR